MTIVVLLVLAVIWAAVLVPPYLEKRRSFHPNTSIGDFRHQLAVLQRTGDPYAPPALRPSSAWSMTRADAMRRRREVFTTLSAAAVLSFLLALPIGGVLWLLHLTVDAALLGYTAMLLQIQQTAPRRVALHQQMVGSQPVLAGSSHYAGRTDGWSDTVAYLPRAESATQQALQRRSAN